MPDFWAWLRVGSQKSTTERGFLMKVKMTLLSVLALGLVCATTAIAQGKGKGGGGGEPTGYGNNLSYPVIFAEGYGITGLPLEGLSWSDPTQPGAELPTAGDATGLRPLTGEVYSTFPWLVTPYPANSGYYAQNTENTWRAQWVAGTPGTFELVQVDWGDNLISQSWTASQPIRVETVLRKPLTSETSMIGYPMTSLLGSRRSEIVGTTGVPEDMLGATVYSRTAHLLIQKLDNAGNPIPTYGCNVSKAVYDTAVDGPGNYAAEINVVGSLIYGYNWNLGSCTAETDASKAGDWLITFMLDPPADTGGITRNAKIIGVADISSPITTVSYDEYSSSLKIKILSTRPTGGKGRNR